VKLIVGLGNPGPEYALTPHNAGFLAVDRIAAVCNVQIANRRGRALTARTKLAGHDVLLAKPETFMNLSGLSVAALLDELHLGVEDLIVLHDELDFPLGTLRIAQRGSANGHNGVKSVSGVLGTDEWLRVRIGVGKPPLDDGRKVKAGGADYLRAVEAVLTKGVSAAMNEFNRKVEPESRQ
jgi:PTH1 family peptidyl-tRNA hydrolase